MAGWFLTDAGAHGAPRDGLRTGALAWLMAHGSGVHVDGVLVTVVPLGITLACAWATWRTAYRLGDSVSGHGPDADRIADGERDWTVPVAALVFTSGYVATAVARRHAGVDPVDRARPGPRRAVVGRALRAVRRPRDRGRLRPGRGVGGLAPRVAWSPRPPRAAPC